MESLTSNEIGKHEKIKTHFARIVVGGTAEKPCYGILYFDPSDGEYHQGFGSYVLEYVFNWLAEEFEITGDAFSNEPVRHGRWENGVCTVCGAEANYTERAEDIYDYDWAENLRYSHTEYNREYEETAFCLSCGAKMDGGVTDD